jgi:hypothetical protein
MMCFSIHAVVNLNLKVQCFFLYPQLIFCYYKKLLFKNIAGYRRKILKFLKNHELNRLIIDMNNRLTIHVTSILFYELYVNIET